MKLYGGVFSGPEGSTIQFLKTRTLQDTCKSGWV